VRFTDRRGLGAGAAFAALLAGACASEPPPAETPPVATIASSAPITPESPPVRSATDGLEVRWWVARDELGAVGRALASAADPAAVLPPDIEARWNAAGLRLVRIPVDRFPEAAAALPPLRTAQRTWLGWAPRWTEVFRGRRSDPSAEVLTQDGRVRLPAGTARSGCSRERGPPRGAMARCCGWS
jgi:hypothetical protein